jgi:hypothetical protein
MTQEAGTSSGLRGPGKRPRGDVWASVALSGAGGVSVCPELWGGGPRPDLAAANHVNRVVISSPSCPEPCLFTHKPQRRQSSAQNCPLRDHWRPQEGDRKHLHPQESPRRKVGGVCLGAPHPRAERIHNPLHLKPASRTATQRTFLNALMMIFGIY